MQDIFQKVQTNFMELGIFFSGLDLEKDLDRPAVIKEVYSALRKSNDLFETGLCEAAHMCSRCSANQEQLNRLVVQIGKCVEDEKMNVEAYRALEAFVHIIPATLLEMRHLYLESLSQGKA